MKIAHIAPPWITIPPKNYGGTEFVLYNLVEELVTQGHDVTVFAPGDARTSAKLVSFLPEALIDSGVPWAAHLKAFYHIYKAVEYIKKHDFDILHSHLSSAADMYIFPLTAHLNTPHVVTLHSCFPFDRVGSWTGDADEFYMEWVASVPMVAVSEAACDKVPYDLNFVGIIHHGLPMEEFHPTVEQPEDFFVWLGRFVPDKGPDLAIQAARRAGVPLVLAGTIDQYVPESVEYFEQVIKPEIDGRQIRYIGPVDKEQKIHLLSQSRGFLNPLRWEEPFGMVMIEAMALGCPVIAFPRGAAPELIVHRKSGFLAHDVDEMVYFIKKIDSLDRAMVRAHAEQHFSARVMAEKYVNIYKKIILSSRWQRRTTTVTPSVRQPLIASSAPEYIQNKLACSGSESVLSGDQGKGESGTSVLTR